MVEIVTLQLPETLVQKAKQIAAFTHRRLEDVLLEWIDRAITELPMESLSVTLNAWLVLGKLQVL